MPPFFMRKEVKRMESLREQIKLLSQKESELLKADRLSKKQEMKTGLYLLCEDGRYTAYDYAERQSWREMFGGVENAPTGWSKEFTNPLDAIDWLLSLK